MENNTQTFEIYRDGRIDRSYKIKMQAKSALRYAARQTYRGILGTFDVLDELVNEYQKLDA